MISRDVAVESWIGYPDWMMEILNGSRIKDTFLIDIDTWCLLENLNLRPSPAGSTSGQTPYISLISFESI